MFHKIIIIGAGMAGLGAATKLEELNFKDYIIVEAQDEPGGRIRTVEVEGKPLDLGAQWLHGKQNQLYEIAKKHNLLSTDLSVEGEGVYVRDDGVIIDEYLVKMVDFQVGLILEECEKFAKDMADYPKSVGEFMHDRFVDHLKDDTNDVREMKLELLDWHKRFQVIDNSCKNLNELSAKSWGEYVCIDDTAHYNLMYGYKSLIDVLVNDIPNNRIHLNTAITRIEYDNKSNGQIILYTTNGESFHCDHLIITASLGCLKANSMLDIFPQLPKTLTNCINSMGFYAIGKIYLFFEYRWWNGPGFQLIWRNDTELDGNEQWLRQLTGFDVVFNQPNALLGWVGGESVGIMEQLSEQEVGEACIRLLKKFLSDLKIAPLKKVIRYANKLIFV